MTANLTTKSLFEREDVKQKFRELLGKRATSFMTSVLQISSQNSLLAKADPVSIYQAAAVAATLDLPLNQNLGFAYIIPYKSKQPDGTYKDVAQFQIGYKGFIQLAQRSGQFKTISASPIFEGQLVEQNPLTGFVFDFTKKTSEKVVGYAAHFALLNGFEKTLFMTADELKKHGAKFSQTFKKGYGLWKDDFDSMAIKTVLKLLLSKFAPLSVEMQKAVITDQAVINDAETEDISYADHEEVEIDKEAERLTLMINDAQTIDELESLAEHVPEAQMEFFTEKKAVLQKIKK
jgi:recombination protein RecT